MKFPMVGKMRYDFFQSLEITMPFRIAHFIALTLAAAMCSGCFARHETAVPILMYHRIGSPTNEWTIMHEAFDAQLAALRRAGYETVLPGDLPDIAAGKKSAPPKPVRPNR